MQMTRVTPSIDFLDASKIRKLIHSKGYFRGPNSWSLAFDCLLNHDLVICALGELVGHLSRLMVSTVVFLFYHLLFYISFLNQTRKCKIRCNFFLYLHATP